MTGNAVLVIALTAFIAGAAAAVFAMVVIGIRKVDRPRNLPPARPTPVDAATRALLSAGSWPNGPAAGDRESGWPAP